ncbi:helix-turn-helix domain-containing protein [Flavobacterium sp. ZB4R12]|uniref:helix-turn-helix domain-containing protein n=1 Tax=Flavobacterium sp. ZB4R12 TaxID=3398732 RepID=UPI003AACFA91
MMDISNTNWIAMSDATLIETIAGFVKHHRLLQNKTQQQVAEDAGINRSTLNQLEKGERITLKTLIQVLRTLNLLYVMDVFKIQEQISPLQLAKLEQNKRQRARNNENTNQNETDW